MTLSMFVKGKVDFEFVQILPWVFLLTENLTLDMFKCDFKYICQRKSLTLNMSKYDFKYVYQRRSWLLTCPNIT
jgi:hypothetical protein